MTTLISWIAVDSRGPSAIYIASDSRITWKKAPRNANWDYAQKIFTSRTQPDIFGYYGDVLFPTQVLSNVVDQIDDGFLFDVYDSPNSKADLIFKTLKDVGSTYPSEDFLLRESISIIYCTRSGENMDATFHSYLMTCRKNEGWKLENSPIPTTSKMIHNLATGAAGVAKWNDAWNSTSEGNTSRAVFSSLCDSLAAQEDMNSGGAPQLAGLYRIEAGKTIGVIHKKTCFYQGLKARETDCLSNIEWRNRWFERCDWKSKDLLEGAQKHEKPDKSEAVIRL